ncbi:ARS binding protein 2-domain-containing protein [Mucor mucedo]|uniref:ARS binding protein 2-domain-containing protein n=1 Tax=Mucor mucedo TaxID=29922 RepID=UPI00222076B6|nr:ARS binding protein 2-domain-containing protein [Mucor mucedo]KAI7873516.1 ARS binding protein 2-domain-containing protein [Mucor mucedo]
MNLSDLVHRTAGDNKVLTTASKTSCNVRGNNNLFQQGPSTTNNGMEPSSFLFNMPNVTPSEWMKTNLFFNNTTDLETTPGFPFNEPAKDTAQKPYATQNIVPYTNANFQRFDAPAVKSPPTKSPSTKSPSTKSPCSPPPIVKKPPEKTTKVTITGDNVSCDTIEDGYIQFVLEHDPNYISDGIESLMYAKRKFSSVPKTGDLSYTTWDIYQLVLKLHKKEIKNWSQLVGQLGLVDMAGRPQFAQRVKRWMHRYKIDSYFDFLLGNKYYFNAPSEKYSSCLMMGNYKKRRPNVEPNIESQSDEEDFVSDEHRIPILLAGSRKRMRDHSQNSVQLIENAKQFLRTINTDESDDDERVTGTEEDSDGDIAMIGHEEEGDNNDEGEDEVDEEEEEEEEEEEDELASTSSSPGSPTIFATRVHPITIISMKKETSRLKAYIATLESTIQQQSSMNDQMNKLLRQKARSERWRKQLIEDITRGPSLTDEEDEDEFSDGQA